MGNREKLNLYDIKMIKCGVVSDLLEGRLPKESDYISNDALTEAEFNGIIDEMINERLITDVLSAKDAGNKRLANWWDETEVTDRGRIFYTNFMNNL